MERFVSLRAYVAQHAASATATASPAPAPRPKARHVSEPAPILGAGVTLDDARRFMASLRQAGKRPNDHGIVVPTGDDDLRRRDEASAVKAFVGDSGLAPGSQLDNARAIALALINPVERAARAWTRGASPSVGGFTAGVNDAASAVARNDGMVKAALRAAIDDAAAALAAGDSEAFDAAQARAVRIRQGIVG